MKFKIIIVLLLIGCGSPKSSDVVEKEAPPPIMSNFQKTVENLPLLSLPLQFASDQSISSFVEPKLYQELLKDDHDLEGLHLIGKLNDSDLAVLIWSTAAANGSPLLTVHNAEGKRIDDLLLFPTAGGDMGYYSDNYTNFTSRKEFVLIDSVLTRQINEEGDDEIPGTDSTYTIIKYYMVSENGIIIRK